MAQKIWYAESTVYPESRRHASGVHNPISLVIAESEDEAVKLLKDFISAKGIDAVVKAPDDASAEWGHGLEVETFLTDGKHAGMTWREIIDSYMDRYNHAQPQIFEERGEILYQNDYTQIGNFTKPFQPPKNKFVPIDIADIDKLDSGIAFVADESEKDSMGFILAAEKITNDDGSIIIRQAQILPDGSLNVRTFENGTWSEFEHVYTEEAPEDGKYYMRKEDKWEGFEFDTEPTEKSTNLVNSGVIKDYVERRVARLYRYKGSVDTLSDLPTDGMIIGDAYNIKTKSSLTLKVDGNDVVIWADSGDNVVWNGTSWDNLSGFIDMDNYVKFTDYATPTKGGVVKVAGYGLAIGASGVLSTNLSSNDDIDKRSSRFNPIVPANLDYAVRSVLPATSQEAAAILVANTEYYLDEVAELSFAFPATGKLGEYCFIKFVSGATACVLSVTGDNYVGDIPMPVANKTYELLATWNGSKWVCNYRGY